MNFTGPAEPVGDGFVVRDPDGRVRVPDQMQFDDGLAWRLRFDPPIGPGLVAVRWNVQAPDAHPIAGSFVFTIDAALGGADAAPTTVTTTANTLDNGLQPQAEDDDSDPARTELTVPEAVGDAAVVELEDFLKAAEAKPAGTTTVGWLGRLLAMVGGAMAIGGAVFALAVLAPADRERPRVLGWAALAGLAAAVGGGLEFAALIADANGAWSMSELRTLAEAPNRAVFFRVVGGLVLGGAAAIGMRRASRKNPSSPPVLGKTFVIGLTVGVIVFAGSYSFDGHTVTAGERLITSAVDFVHVLAGAVWAGGVATLAAVLRTRHRRGQALDGLGLGTRFSVVAAIAVAAAGVAGTILAVTILDSISALWLTSWGRMFVAKIVFAYGAAAIGAYNHFRVIPLMSTESSRAAGAQELRKMATIEAASMLGVLAVTAVLVVASAR